MIPATTTRVRDNTDEAINQRIHQQIERNILYFGGKGFREIDRRLEELDREWDVERLLETNASSLALLGLDWARSLIVVSSCSRQLSQDFCCSMPFKAGVLPSQCSGGWEFVLQAKSMPNAMRSK